MDRSDFLKVLARECRTLRDALAPDSRKWFVDMVKSGIDANPPEGPSPIELSTDRIYELMCYFYIVKGLIVATERWQPVRGQGPHGYRMPYSPGKKESFAFFRFEEQGVIFDLCCGTEIPVDNEPPEAPDISLQSAAGWGEENRSPGTVVGLWEGKYHSGKNAFSRGDKNQMLARCDVFPLPEYGLGDDLLALCPEPFRVSVVVTNAQPVPINRSQCLRHRFSIIFSFWGTDKWTIEPTRAEHMTFAKPATAQRTPTQ